MITKEQIEQIEKFEIAIKNQKAIGDHKKDKEMVALFKKDRTELREVVSLIKQGKDKQAGEMAWDLDSVVRDVIPIRVYNFIMKEAGYN